MAKKICPMTRTVAISQDCADCSEKACRKIKYRKMSIGIDQSYKRTGISIAADGVLLKVSSIDLSAYESRSEARKALRRLLVHILEKNASKSLRTVCIVERVRQFSQGFISMPYITGWGALTSVIVDVCADFGIPVYSVDTRCWKAQVIGTSKPKANKYGVPDEKYPCVEWVCSNGFEGAILEHVEGRRTKGTFIASDGVRMAYNDDAADSAGIAMFPFVGDHSKLKLEK